MCIYKIYVVVILMGRQICNFCYCDQGIVNMNRNGNSEKFFFNVCNGKRIKELFVSTLNGIAACVRYLSFIIVVLNAELTRLIAAPAKKNSKKQKSPERVPFCAS